jgi:DNA-binding sugar fermentation-stimulating protein
MNVELPSGELVLGHCPATSNISDFTFEGMDALVSHHPGRIEAGSRTDYTVEAISLSASGDPSPRWAGINQGRSNRIAEHFIEQQALRRLTGKVRELRREVRHGSSRFDFLVNGNIYLEVKTPINTFPQNLPWAEYYPHRPLTDLSRFMKHLEELSDGLDVGERAVVLQVNQWDAPIFNPPHDVSPTHTRMASLIQHALSSQVLVYQLDLEFHPDRVEYLRLRNLDRKIKQRFTP